ncbi:MAG TPA: penicillin-binding transpeptidase domain-containing protein [Myxococcaceae bacterium]|nr:penicillin-binding transpeptidase domain-containing protein [Myxococcaceae bacterium]
MRAALWLPSLAVLLTGFTPEDEALDPTMLPGTTAVTAPAEAPEPVAPAAIPLPVPSRVKTPPLASARPLAPAEDLISRARRDGAHYVVSGGEGEAALTLVPSVQESLIRTLRDYQTPWAAVVVIEPSTGRVLAMVEHSEAAPGLRGLPVKAVFPAASIFKLVTASALLDEGVSPDDESCYHGGKRRVSESLLADSQRDRQCVSLSEALGRSANVVFAKLTHRYLDAEKLRAAAELFRFNRPIPFAIPTEPSLAAVPEEPLELARTGAGFGDVFLSPLHGALIASVAANGGLWRAPILFERDLAEAPDPERILSEERAAALTAMMEETVTHGTARRFFRLRELRGAVGKTGSLADRNPFRDYSWFVGFAPREAPRVAVAAVVVNEPRWRIRAPWLAREAMRLGLEAVGGSGAGRLASISEGRSAPGRRSP